MNKSFFSEILIELSIPLAAGDVVRLNDNEHFFDLLSRLFPLGTNRIDWRKVPDAVSLLLKNPKGTKEWISNIQDFIDVAFSAYGINERDKLVWIGDNTDFALEMSAATMLQYAEVLVMYPQQVYLVPDTVVFCINLTIEGELYFGSAPSMHVARKIRNER